jgi:PadR family transcriptional regulator, regulatory protein AphA
VARVPSDNSPTIAKDLVTVKTRRPLLPGAPDGLGILGLVMRKAAVRTTPSVLGCVILQLLDRTPRSGYDLKKRFASTLAIAWHAHDSQIYPELKRLEGRGLVRSRLEPGAAGPPRRVYEITPDGRRVLLDWLRSPLDDLREKNEFLLRIWSVDLIPPASVERLLADFEERTTAHLHRLESLRDGVRERHGRPETASDPRQVGALLCLEHDIMLSRAKLEWLEGARMVIRTRATSGDAAARGTAVRARRTSTGPARYEKRGGPAPSSGVSRARSARAAKS